MRNVDPGCVAPFANSSDAFRTADMEHDQVMVQRRLEYFDVLARPLANAARTAAAETSRCQHRREALSPTRRRHCSMRADISDVIHQITPRTHMGRCRRTSPAPNPCSALASIVFIVRTLPQKYARIFNETRAGGDLTKLQTDQSLNDWKVQYHRPVNMRSPPKSRRHQQDLLSAVRPTDPASAGCAVPRGSPPIET